MIPTPAPTNIIVKLQKHDESLSSGGFILSNNPTELFRGNVISVGEDIEWIERNDLIYFKNGYQIIEDGVDVVAVDVMEVVAKIRGSKESK